MDEFYQGNVVRMFKEYPIGVMRADFWRYAILYIYGGIYMDIDTSPLLTVDKWKNYPFEEN
jgi:mannosyltransferase OCH1-like enzyme